MNLGAKIANIPSENVNLASPLGAVLNLQDIRFGNLQDESNTFQSVLAQMGVEDGSQADQSKISPQMTSGNLLVNSEGKTDDKTGEIINLSIFFNNDSETHPPAHLNTPISAVLRGIEEPTNFTDTTPKVIISESTDIPPNGFVISKTPEVTDSKIDDIVKDVIKEVTDKYKGAQLSEPVAREIVKSVRTKLYTAIPHDDTEPLEIAQDVVADQKPSLDNTTNYRTPELISAFQNEYGTRKTPIIIKSSNDSTNTPTFSKEESNVVIPIANNFTFTKPQIDTKTQPARPAIQQPSRPATISIANNIIDTTLPTNQTSLKVLEKMEASFSSNDFELASSNNEESTFGRLPSNEAVLITQQPKSDSPLPARIAHYANVSTPIENRSEVISQQVVKVLNNTETKTQTITVQLEPVELGKIDIKMDISPKGETKVQILAEKFETYTLLAKSSDQIMGILSDKGINQDSTSLNFGLRSGNGNSNQQFAQHSPPQHNFTSDHNDEQVATLLYKDPDRVDIKA
jgi:flagellar hook-length control protein FliK